MQEACCVYFIVVNYLKEYFSQSVFGHSTDQFLSERIAYNNEHIGSLGYQVYLNTSAGWKSLGYTNNTYFNYTPGAAGTYTFIVQTAYSIFKANASSGISVSYTIKQQQPEPEPEPQPDPQTNPDTNEP